MVFRTGVSINSSNDKSYTNIVMQTLALLRVNSFLWWSGMCICQSCPTDECKMHIRLRIWMSLLLLAYHGCPSTGGWSQWTAILFHPPKSRCSCREIEEFSVEIAISIVNHPMGRCAWTSYIYFQQTSLAVVPFHLCTKFINAFVIFKQQKAVSHLTFKGNHIYNNQ